MKTDYKKGVIRWNGEEFDMDEVRREYVKQYPNQVRQALVKHKKEKTYIDWKHLFSLTNLNLILWNISQNRKMETTD